MTTVDMRGQPWSRPEELQLVERFEAGHNAAELAELHCRSIDAVVTRLVRLNRLTCDEARKAYFKVVTEPFLTFKEAKGHRRAEELQLRKAANPQPQLPGLGGGDSGQPAVPPDSSLPRYAHQAAGISAPVETSSPSYDDGLDTPF